MIRVQKVSADCIEMSQRMQSVDSYSAKPTDPLAEPGVPLHDRGLR